MNIVVPYRKSRRITNLLIGVFLVSMCGYNLVDDEFKWSNALLFVLGLVCLYQAFYMFYRDYFILENGMITIQNPFGRERLNIADIMTVKEKRNSIVLRSESDNMTISFGDMDTKCRQMIEDWLSGLKGSLNK